MKLKYYLKKFWHFLKEDTWQSWLVSIILIILLIKYILFPFLSLVTGSPLPLVVVESCSMYQESRFNEWWEKNAAWYEEANIEKDEFEEFPFKRGLNKGDIILVTKKENYEVGDIIIFQAPTRHPIIHRVIENDPISTKGDHNTNQLSFERDISEDVIIGKATAKIPFLGWVKLIFFEFIQPQSQRGFCK